MMGGVARPGEVDEQLERLARRESAGPGRRERERNGTRTNQAHRLNASA